MIKVVYRADGTSYVEEYEEETFVESAEDLQRIKSEELMRAYEDAKLQGFVSNATGTPIHFGYNGINQADYGKIANTLALNPAKTSVTFGSSEGIVTMTRAQFVTFIGEAEAFEMGLYMKRKTYEAQIQNATAEELQAMVITF